MSEELRMANNAAEVPRQSNGTFVDENIWNEPVDQINSNSSDIADIQTRFSGAQSDMNKLRTRIGNVEDDLADTSTGNSALGRRVGTLEDRTTDDSTGNSALGERLSIVESGTGEHGVEPGYYRYRVFRTSSGNFTSGPIRWPDNPEFARGVTRTQNDTAFRLTTPGIWVAVVGAGVSIGTLGSGNGNRFMLYVADMDGNRYGEAVMQLPAAYPEVQVTAPILVTEAIEIQATIWTNTTETMPIYTGSQRTSFMVFYLGGGA